MFTGAWRTSGWITGHSYIVYGPLAICASTVVYEGIPTYPDAGRPWRIAQELDVNIFHTAPTAIRALRKLGPEEPQKYNYHFKHMTTVGESRSNRKFGSGITIPSAKVKRLFATPGGKTENGGFLCSTLPAIQPMKTGERRPGAYRGIHPIVLDEDGNVIPPGTGKAGNICIQNPWPGSFQTIWRDRDRYVRQ